MKKLFIFAIACSLFASCQKDEPVKPQAQKVMIMPPANEQHAVKP